MGCTRTASLRNEYAINYINREQQRHFHDNQEFFNQTKLSELSLEEHRPYYDYFVGLESDKAYVYSIAKYKYDRKKILGIDIGINKDKPFYNHVGAVYVEKNNSNNRVGI